MACIVKKHHLKVLFKEMQPVAFFIFHMGKTRMQVKNDLRCVITLLREYITSLTTSVTTIQIFIGNMSTLKAIKTYFRSHMIKRILHSRSFYMKFIKLAEGSFNKFHMK